MTLNGSQLAAARVLVGRRQTEIAKMANIAAETLSRMENATGRPPGHVNTHEAVRRALESCGVEFLDGGVRLRAPAAA